MFYQKFIFIFYENEIKNNKFKKFKTEESTLYCAIDFSLRTEFQFKSLTAPFVSPNEFVITYTQIY